MTVMVENRWQARKVRWITLGFVLWCAGFLYWSADLYQTYGLAPGDGGELRPWTERAAVAAGVALTGLLPLLGTLWYIRRYIVRMERVASGIAVTVLGLSSPVTRVHPVSDFGAWREHRGEFRGRISVKAPWITLVIAGRLHIVDLQSEYVDRSAIRNLSAQGARAGKPNRAERRRRGR